MFTYMLGPPLLLHTADVHGAAFSRDIEPSVEGGTKLYDIMASCVKMFKNGNKGCTSITTKEPCCIGARRQHVIVHIESLMTGAACKKLVSQSGKITEDGSTEAMG